MLSSSKSDSKQEVRFAARLDVLMERVDTLAATVATTASAIAKKDGEIASLRRDLQSRDETLQTLVAQISTASQTPEGGPVVDTSELRSLRNAVAALTKEHAQAGNSAQVVQRVGALELELASVKAQAERNATEPDRPSEELKSMLATLRGQVEALSGLRSGVSEEQLDRRIAETDGTLARLSERIDSLAGSIESATASLSDKEHELAALHRHSIEASDRIESIVDDIREALSALSEVGSSSVDDIAARVEQLEQAARDATGELARRIDVIDQRVATVATEVARAKTLWPVALRSLEARLDDAVSHGRRHEPDVVDDEAATTDHHHDDEPSDDLLAGLRDSLQAMETVAAEMARASDVLGGPEDENAASELELELEPQPVSEPEPQAPAAAAAAGAGAGATIVPLRAGEP